MLDYAPAPQALFPAHLLRNDFLWNFLMWFFNLFLPGGFLQKIILAVIVFTAGFGMFIFLKRTVRVQHIAGAYFGGILYIFNPFVYSRLMVGQWIIIAAYALLPFLFTSVVRLINASYEARRGWKEALIVAAIYSGMFAVNLHVGIMTILPLVGVGIAALIVAFKKHGYRTVLRLASLFGLSAGLFLLLNAYWVIPTFFGSENIGFFAQHVVSNVDILSFFTRADAHHGVVWNTAGMYGFWADEDNRYVAQKLLVPYWFYLLFVLLALVACGLMVAVVRPKRLLGSNEDKIHALWPRAYSIGLALASFVAFAFALGVAYKPLSGVMLWIYDHVPYFRGFREPHKFVALVVFAYAIFGSIGVATLVTLLEKGTARFTRYARFIVPALLLLVPLSYSPGLLWGLNRQLPVGTYPESWYKADAFLMSDQDTFNVLVVPWHQYIELSFAKNIVINPADGFFHKPVLAGDNVEFGPIYTQSTRPESQVIEGLLRQGKNMKTMGSVLDGIQVKYVIWLLESDFFTYSYIEKQKDLSLVFEDAGIKVFENKAWHKTE